MNSLLRIFMALAILNISVHALKCEIELVKENTGYKFAMDNVCKCMGYADSITGGTKVDGDLKIVNGSLVLINAEEICRNVGFEKKTPVPAADGANNNNTASSEPVIPKDETTSTTSTTEKSKEAGTAGSLSGEHKGTSTTTIVLILFFSLFFGCLFAWVSKIVYNKYKSKEYELPPDQQEMETRPRSIREDTRIDTN